MATTVVPSESGPKVGLYYPHIHFRDEEWLKTSVLYWDRLARIVPAGYPPDDSDTVRRLQSEYGLIVNLRPDPAALDSVAKAFLKLIELRGDELRMAYALEPRHGGAVTLEGRPVHSEILAPKLHYALSAALREAGLAVNRSDRSGLGSVYLHSDLAGAYMAGLASRMAEAARCELTSDSPVDHIAASGLTR
jgi:hypothetical protein